MEIVKAIETEVILTDGGLETDLIFNHGIELQEFAAFPLVENPELLETLLNYYREYLDLAKKHQTGFILESPTWRANLDWGMRLGYELSDLVRINRLAIEQLRQLREEYRSSVPFIQISGQIGPRGDGYEVGSAMSVEQALHYHDLQVSAFKLAGVDLVTAITMTYSDEALGIIKAAQNCNLPVVISFTVDVDGQLPSGESLEEVIIRLDEQTHAYPSYYMINCAHPSHFAHLFETEGIWKHRIQGLRANASCKSHAELDQATELDAGNRKELGHWHMALKSLLPNLKVYGGCCGTDATHVEVICSNIIG